MKKAPLPIHSQTRRALCLIAVLLAGVATSTSSAQERGVATGSKPAKAPEGVIKGGEFSKSAIFPGTHRGFAVFIPAQYDGSKPACVYVKTDGYNPAEKTALGSA